MIKPKESDTLDFEAELAVIIGTRGQDLRGNAFGHIAGYSCYNDGSVRSFKSTTQFTPGKISWELVALPWMVTLMR